MGYFISQGRKSLFTDPYIAIPGTSCMVIETKDLLSFINLISTGKGLFGELGNVREFDNFNKRLKYIADQLNKPGFRKLFDDHTSIISFQADKTGKLQLLVSVAAPVEIRRRQIKEILHSSGIDELTENRSNGNYEFKIPYIINNLRDTAYISLVSGLVLFSNSENLMKEGLAQTTKGTDVRTQNGFSRVLQASGKNEDKIFVIFANIPGLFKKILGGKGVVFEEKLAKLAGTAGGDIFIKEDGLVLSGYTESVDSSEVLYTYKFLPPQEFHTYKILPSATVLFETIIVPQLTKVVGTGSKISVEAVKLNLRLKESVKGEITRAYIDIRDKPVSDNTLIIYELNNRVLAEQLFLEELGTSKEILYFQPDDQTKVPVYKTSFKGFVETILPGFAPEANETYFAFYDNFMIAGSSFSTITRLLYDNLLNKTLANDLIYRDFESSLPSRAGYYFFCVPSRIIDYAGGFLNDNLVTALKANKLSLSKIQSAGFQLASSNGMIYNSLSVKFKEEAREESTTEWETLLDTVASIKPFFFTNHTTRAKEIFIQDMKNNTYLINAAGRVLWKVPLNERITGSVYLIDYFRNGKFQLLFSGRNYLHILDRNGNYVERYPVKLRSPASNSLALFDYDNNLNYRLFIAGEDKSIYSYDKTGSVVKGWNPFRTAGIVSAEISYFKVSGKDYIVVSDENSIYFLDRSGNKRINLKEPVKRAVGSTMKFISGSESHVICSSPDGIVQQIYFDGSVKKFSLKRFSDDHSFDIFDVDGDGFGEYIFIEKGKLFLYNHNRAEIFTRDFGTASLGGPINFIFAATERRIGVFDKTKNLIYLIDKNGKTMNGFPLRGASMFSIGKLSDQSSWHLIVGGTDRFLYNYKIDKDFK
jgi:hypothetical protein